MLQLHPQVQISASMQKLFVIIIQNDFNFGNLLILEDSLATTFLRWNGKIWIVYPIPHLIVLEMCRKWKINLIVLMEKMNFLQLHERVSWLIQVNFYSRIFVVVWFRSCVFNKWCKPHETRKRWRNFAPWINDNQLLKETASKSLKLSQEEKMRNFSCITYSTCSS